MTNDNDPSDAGLRLYHAPSSYYSMIARLALAEAGLAYEPVFIDIHYRMDQQQPDYVRLNPNMTVPTLATPDAILDQSRHIVEYAFRRRRQTVDAESARWLGLHYSFPIEELTFGGLLAHNRLARIMIPKRLAAARRRLLAMANANPDLASVYAARAAVFGERLRVFDPASVEALSERRRAEAIALLDRLEANVADGREAIAPPRYGAADVVWTVFLARMEFASLGAEIARRPSLARYWRAMQTRPSFPAADIWTRLHLGRLIAGILGFVR